MDCKPCSHMGGSLTFDVLSDVLDAFVSQVSDFAESAFVTF